MHWTTGPGAPTPPAAPGTARRSSLPWPTAGTRRTSSSPLNVVAGGAASLALTVSWLPALSGYRLVLVAVQDGMLPEHVRPLLGDATGVFVGGTTAWKLRTLPLWGRLCREAGAWLHVGRVNSARRVHYAAMCGAGSFDGSSVARFPSTIRLLDRARRQPPLLRLDR